MLNVGEKAPVFSGVDYNGTRISLLDFKGKKVILYFYPRDNTPGCTAEACDLNLNFDELTEKGFAVVGVSPDSEASHKKFHVKYHLRFDLIADTKREILKMYGAWGEKNLYGKIFEGVLRTTFIIDEQGIITHIFKKVNTKNHTNQILTELEK